MEWIDFFVRPGQTAGIEYEFRKLKWKWGDVSKKQMPPPPLMWTEKYISKLTKWIGFFLCSRSKGHSGQYDENCFHFQI